MVQLADKHLKCSTPEETRWKDSVSHFVLRLAYCRRAPLCARSAGVPSQAQGPMQGAMKELMSLLRGRPGVCAQNGGPAALVPAAGVRPVPAPLQERGPRQPGAAPQPPPPPPPLMHSAVLPLLAAHTVATDPQCTRVAGRCLQQVHGWAPSPSKQTACDRGPVRPHQRSAVWLMMWQHVSVQDRWS